MEKKMIINFDKIDSGVTDTLLPPGKCRLLVKGFEKSTAKTGTHQVMCTMEILDKPEFEGCMKREYFPLDERALWRIGQFIKALTDTTAKEMDVNSTEFDDLLDDCVERPLFIVYGVEEFNGLERNFSRRYLRDTGQTKESPPKKVN